MPGLTALIICKSRMLLTCTLLNRDTHWKPLETQTLRLKKRRKKRADGHIVSTFPREGDIVQIQPFCVVLALPCCARVVRLLPLRLERAPLSQRPWLLLLAEVVIVSPPFRPFFFDATLFPSRVPYVPWHCTGMH